jgi:hypothetical protein
MISFMTIASNKASAPAGLSPETAWAGLGLSQPHCNISLSLLLPWVEFLDFVQFTLTSELRKHMLSAWNVLPFSSLF